MKLWELLHSVPLTGETPDLEMEINSISYDTRTLKPGALFDEAMAARFRAPGKTVLRPGETAAL